MAEAPEHFLFPPLIPFQLTTHITTSISTPFEHDSLNLETLKFDHTVRPDIVRRMRIHELGGRRLIGLEPVEHRTNAGADGGIAEGLLNIGLVLQLLSLGPRDGTGRCRGDMMATQELVLHIEITWVSVKHAMLALLFLVWRR